MLLPETGNKNMVISLQLPENKPGSASPAFDAYFYPVI